jgi:UPF0755 protein
MRTFKILLLVILLTMMSVVALGTWQVVRPLGMDAERVSFTVPTGAGLRATAQVIEAAGVHFPAWQFSLLGRLMGHSSRIKAGSYEIARGQTAISLFEKLINGDVTQGQVVLVEGKTFRQFRSVLDQNPDLRHDTLPLSDVEVLKRLQTSEIHPEGLFFPDTYLFDKGSSDLDVLRRAYRAMQIHLAEAWQARSPDLRLKTPYELLILASIAEKETGLAADRPHIAAVFSNRLKRGMPLQTDPTVIYGLGERFDGNLRRADLTADTPWNTYTRGGLPPTPIAMPGLASLQAASHPPASEMLYFVARGDGSSEFSSNLADHNRAVARFQKR